MTGEATERLPDTTLMNNDLVIGTCGNCGGPVMTPYMWMGVIPPTPRCMQCGAVPANPHGPIIPMKPPQAPWNRGTQPISWPPTATSDTAPTVQLDSTTAVPDLDATITRPDGTEAP